MGLPLSATARAEWLADAPQPGRKTADFGAQPLPCLNSNNSNEGVRNPESLIGEILKAAGVKLSPSEKKGAFALAENVKSLCESVGIERIGFLTLSFVENLEDPKEAQRRFNSLKTGFLGERFQNYICVLEKQKRGAVHFHLLVACQENIQTGFDWEALSAATEQGQKTGWKSGPYYKKRAVYVKAASPYLRRLWGDLRNAMPRYGFGRSELLPVKTTEGGIANYVGKYMEIATSERGPELKGVRLVRYSLGKRVEITYRDGTSKMHRQSFRRARQQLQFNSPRAKLWRQKLERFAREHSVADLDGMKTVFGPKWAYRLKDIIAKWGEVDEAREASTADLIRQVEELHLEESERRILSLPDDFEPVHETETGKAWAATPPRLRVVRSKNETENRRHRRPAAVGYLERREKLLSRYGITHN